MSGCSPAGIFATKSDEVWTSPCVTVPLLHSTTAVPDGSSVEPVAAAMPPSDAPTAAAPSTTEPTRTRQRPPRTLRSLLAISGCPFREQTTGPPICIGLGPVSLWLPASSSDQFSACGSMPPRWKLWLLEVPGASVLLVGFPARLQAVVSNHREWLSVKRPGSDVADVAYSDAV